jgi:hypothetical protein
MLHHGLKAASALCLSANDPKLPQFPNPYSLPSIAYILEGKGLAMTDPQHLGLGELGQRVQALSDPVPNSEINPAIDSRLRPYQGAPLPIGPSANNRPIPSYGSEETNNSPLPSASTASAPSPYVNPLAQSSSSYSSQANGQVPNPVANPFTSQFSSQPPRPSESVAQPTPFRPYDAGTSSSQAPAWEDVSTPSTPPDQAGSHPTENHNGATQSAPGLPGATASSVGGANPGDSVRNGIQRALNAVRSTIPLVQKLLPLLDGNFATAITALMAPQSHPQPVQVDLEPVERSLAEVRNSHRELKTQVQEQVTTLKRVEDQLERVREATDRNTLEQQELVEDLRAVGSRLGTFAIIGISLLVISLGLNIYFLVQLQHILR